MSWQEECELKGATQVYHRRRFLPLPTELEVTKNFGDFWVSLFHIRNLLRCLIRTLPRDGCCEIDGGDARRHLVCDAESCDRITKQRRQLCGYIVAGRSGHGARFRRNDETWQNRKECGAGLKLTGNGQHA